MISQQKQAASLVDAPPRPPVALPLVYIAKSVDTSIDTDTGELLDIQTEYCNLDALKTRFKMQRAAVSFLSPHTNPRGDKYRVSSCMHTRVASSVDIVASVSGSCSYKGLATCGSVWTCPVCASKISEYRKKELSKALDTFTAGGGICYMVTYTVPHKKHMLLSDVLGTGRSTGLAAANYRLRMSRPVNAMLKKAGVIGSIRVLEVTYGANGWHPHIHMLYLLSRPLPEKAKTIFFKAWSLAVESSGLRQPTYKHGVDVKRAYSPAEYVTKYGRATSWGTSSEITKAHIKTGFHSLTPFDFLRSDRPDLTAPLFAEYAHAFHGRRQLYYSSGLKSLLCVDTHTDEQISQGVETSSKVMALTPDHWRTVIKHDKSHNTRALVLKLAQTGGSLAVIRFLQSL
jgi:hypothetical protein